MKHILKCEANGQTPTIHSISGTLGTHPNQSAEVLRSMESRDLISYQQGELRLLPAGRKLASHVIRAHRLWESYLADQTGVAEAQWHSRAERQEHLLTPQQADDLAARLGHPLQDPHGDAIPSAGEGIKSDAGQSLNSVPENVPFVIAHIEDEPETIYARLCAKGLRPGMKLCVTEKSPRKIRLWAEGRNYELPPIWANNISVLPLAGIRREDILKEEYLDQLQPGETAKVVALSAACRGPERRRLLDLGFVPNTDVGIELTSPLRDPVAYRVRGSVVALRSEQSGLIQISRQALPPRLK